MVKIEEVSDEWSDASSVASLAESDVSDQELALYDPSQETLRERLAALKDMVPPTTRQSIADTFHSGASWVKWTGGKLGNAAWIVTTSALVVGLPLMLSIEGEAAIVAQEKEYLGAQVRFLFQPRGDSGSARPRTKLTLFSALSPFHLGTLRPLDSNSSSERHPTHQRPSFPLDFKRRIESSPSRARTAERDSCT